ncbi:GTP cyclohydrolase II [Tranquillimonas alkanivorans]|uniref:GTP cyclohydrolase-2 n=1 Tax=Tranquillimonas alkanivorans TaxID=441119 RepID=A0A1I5W790_9RHOB|nr:GTP cyclohydrolase II [Tranquillimonas alkanivorans]SFQ15487.1 GTP cyclohydrolase II [Tranquillimonas alkanivorans]
MPFAPSPIERLARARSDLRMGLPVVLSGPDSAALVAAPEVLSSERLAEFLSEGEPVLAITHRRAETLKIRVYDEDLARLPMPRDMQARELHAIVDPKDDLSTPMKGPFRTERAGDATLHRAAIALVKSARLLPAALVRPVEDGEALAREVGLTTLDLGETDPLFAAAPKMSPVVSARLPMAAARAGRLHIFRPDDGGDEHYAVEVGQPNRDHPVLVRLHSACFTGDILGSLKCDCGPQLNGALAQMAAEGAGVLLYLNQEGRGIGLANKMRAYSLQDQGFDTVEANHRLGFEDDERDFRIGAQILRRMGFTEVRLLTNNPRKVDMLAECGLRVTERVPLAVGRNPLNADYLATKASKSGHLF